MNWSDFATANVVIGYANMAKMNKIRAWAKRNGCSVKVSRYAHDAYNGRVSFPMDEGRAEQQAKIAAFKAEFAPLSIA